MPDTIFESPSEAAQSKEMRKFFRALAAVQTNAIFRVMNAKDAAHMNQLAARETDHLLSVSGDNSGRPCPAGMIWDTELEMCVVATGGDFPAAS